MKGRYALAIALFVLIAATAAASDLRLDGKPLVERIDIPLDVFPAHFAVAYGEDGTVFVGSSDGLLIGDGERWRLIDINGQLVRSLLAKGPRVYVGGYDAYGFVERDRFGRFAYTELASARPAGAAPEGFADIWRIVSTPEGIVFGALRDMFVFAPDSNRQTHFAHAGRFGAIDVCGGATLAQFRGEGFRAWRNGTWEPLPHTAALTQLVANLVPLDDACLGVSNQHGLFKIDAERVRTVDIPAGLSLETVHQTIRLADGSVLMTTAIGELVVLDPTLQRARRFAVHPGFVTDATRAGNQVLVSATTALYQFSWPSAVSAIGSATAGQASNTRAKRDGNRVLLFRDSGVGEVLADANGEAIVRDLDWTRDASYDYAPGAGSRPPLLALGHALVQLSPRVDIDPATYPRLLIADRHDPQSVFVGTEHGLRQLRWENAAWRLTEAPAGSDGNLVVGLIQVGDRAIYVGTARDGLWHATLGPDRQIATRERMPGSSGFVDVFLDGEVPMASTVDGVYRIDGLTLRSDERFAAALDARRRNEALHFVADADILWAHTSTQLFVRDATGWQEVPFFYPAIGPILDVVALGGGRALIVGSDGTLHYDREVDAGRTASPSTLMISAAMRIDRNGAEHPLPVASQEPVVLAPSDLGVRVQFALSGLRPARRALYRGRLVNYEPSFSAWERSAGYTYTRLRPGDYALEIEAKDAAGVVYKAPLYPIRFSAKWHELAAVRIALIGVGLLAVVLLASLLYRRRTNVLRQMVADRTSELAAANRRLEELAHHDALTQLPNRRRFDDYLNAIWSACSLQHRSVALLVIDVDHFKTYNDRHGHAAGDALLLALAQVLRASVRRSEDLVARYGGEEFVVVMPGAHLAAAQSAAEQLRLAVIQAHLGVTVSIGAASGLPSETLTAAQLFERADRALYRAKQGGRDRVVAADPD